MKNSKVQVVRGFIFALAVAIQVSFVFAEDVYVQVRATKLRSEPKIWGKALQDLPYGEKLNSSGNQDGWYQVLTQKGVRGWVHQSAINSRQIVFSTSAQRAAVGKDDIVLAGKGFSREVENSLKATNPKLNFKAVDEVERSKVTPEELRNFIMSGKLNG